jgi:hypothetical protein
MQYSFLWETYIPSAVQEIKLLHNDKFHDSANNSRPLRRLLSPSNQVQTLTNYLFNINFKVTFQPTPVSYNLPRGFASKFYSTRVSPQQWVLDVSSILSSLI